jgi:hypothetical protein
MDDYSFVVREHDPFYIQALVLSKVVERILLIKADLRLSSRPGIEKRPIVHFMNRIRVNGLEKFDQKTYVSVVNYYRGRREERVHKAAGAVILYLTEEYISCLLPRLDYPLESCDDQEGMADGCGAFCNLIAGNFKNGLSSIGYQELIMSHFSTHENSVVDGVEYDQRQTGIYEISFQIDGIRRIVVDLTMGPIGHKSDLGPVTPA